MAVIDKGAGNELVRAGNGRDIIIGVAGGDELHGYFGLNIYKSQIDGFSDLIAVKSDEHLINYWLGGSGNNLNGVRCDIIEGLDSVDKIVILGVFTPEINVRSNASAHGLTGLGIYARNSLEALYIGNNLSAAQLASMTTGDGSPTAMANQVSSYGWTGV